MKHYIAGDTIKLHGERMNGYSHVFTLTIAEVFPEEYDSEWDDFVPFKSTKGHTFNGQVLESKNWRKVGRYFYDVEIVE